MTGASLALAGLSGCRYLPQKKIVPYVWQPADMILGTPMYYATSISPSGSATGRSRQMAMTESVSRPGATKSEATAGR